MVDSDAPSQVAILRLDTDWHKSTKKELSVLAPKVSKGGFIIIDDYCAWERAKKATDEFLANNLNRFEVIDKHSPEPLIIKRIL